MGHKEQTTELITAAVAAHNDRGFYREPLVGFSSPGDPLYRDIKETVGPHHLYPEEILSQVQTVISFFIPFSKALVNSNQHQWQVSRDWVESYADCNALIGRISQQVSQQYQDWGFEAATAPATRAYDPVRLVAGWSHRSAAYVAGLGTFGINRMLITSMGCAGRYGTVFVSERLDPDHRPEEERCILLRGGYCRSCVNRCPVGALTLEGFGRFRCRDQLNRNAAAHPDLAHSDVCGKCAVGRCAILEE